jgi:predicted ATPase
MFRRVEVRHYKILKRVDVRLSALNILIGPNASGKSTLLDVLAFLQSALTHDVEKAVRERAPIVDDLVWKRQDVETGFEIAVECAAPNDRSLRYEVQIGLGEDGELSIRAESLFVLPATRAVPAPSQTVLFPFDLPDDSPIVLSPNKKMPAGWKKIVSRGETGSSNFQSESTSWTTAYRLPALRLSLSGVPEDEDRFPLALWLKRLLMDGVQFIQLNSVRMRRPSPRDSLRRFQVDGSNLPIVVDELRTAHPERFDWWIAHLQTLLPNLQSVEVSEREEDRSRFIVVSYAGGLRAPAWLLSDGTLRMLALTLIAYLPPENAGVFMIEEPENGLHPRVIEGVYQSLSSPHESQILLTTHSPLFLNLAQPDDMVIFARTAQDGAAAVRGSAHPMLKDWRAGVSLSTLFAAGVFES